MISRIYTWGEINDPKVVNYRNRAAAIHARRLADSPEYAANSAHWDSVRRALTGPALPADHKPPLTLVEQADRQIATLEREMAEWRRIKESAQ